MIMSPTNPLPKTGVLAGLSKLVPVQKARPPKKNIPPTPALRTQVMQAARHYVAEFNPVGGRPANAKRCEFEAT